MGVQGLWKLVEPCGRVVPVEALSGKVLAVDVSIWLHRAMKGMQSFDGYPVTVATLIVIFSRLCKLLFYKIKPVFVFDGGVPNIKRQTMALRNMKRSKARSEVNKVREKLLKNLLKHEALRHLLTDQNASAALGLNSLALPGPADEEDLYKLPPVADHSDDSNDDDVIEEEEEELDGFQAVDIHSLDINSPSFKSLPAQVRHDILSDLKETRKQNSWRNIDQMPQQSQDFSDFQMQRLLKRRAVQVSLEECGKEMESRDVSMQELQSLLGAGFDSGSVTTGKVAQEDSTRFMLVHKPKPNPLQSDAAKEIISVLSEDKPKERIVKESQEKSVNEIVAVLSDPSDSTTKNEKEIIKDEEEEWEAREKIMVQLLVNEEMEKLDVDGEAAKEKVIEMTARIDEELLQLRANTREIDKTMVTDVTEELLNGNSFVVCSGPSEEMQEEESSKENARPSKRRKRSGEVQIEMINTKISKYNGLEQSNLLLAEESCSCSKTQMQSSQEETGPNGLVTEKDGRNELEERIQEEIGKKVEDEEPIQKDCQVAEIVSEGEEDVPVNRMDEIVDDFSDSDDDDFVPVAMSPLRTASPPKMSSESETSENNATTPVVMSEQDVRNLAKELEGERDELVAERNKQNRLAQSITDEMYADTQELLQLFGIPYIIAPMEAEAQCAALELLGLTEGTITDDSDIWLFGGRNVYKNFLNQDKHLMEFRSDDLKQYFKLTREDMIRLALLVGSDYTPGLDGIGPVTALEVLAAFPNATTTDPVDSDEFLDSLRRFQQWVAGGFKNGPTQASLRSKVKNLSLTPDFPSADVVEAYLRPKVDNSKEAFSWSPPNTELLEKYTRIKFGWTAKKFKEVFVPVMKSILAPNHQPTLERFLRTMLPPVTLSKRVAGAVRKLGQPLESQAGPSKERKSKKDKTAGWTELKPCETKPVDELKARLHRPMVIPQREKDKQLKSQLKKQAIELLKQEKSKPVNNTSQSINLSESSDSE